VTSTAESQGSTLAYAAASFGSESMAMPAYPVSGLHRMAAARSRARRCRQTGRKRSFGLSIDRKSNQGGSTARGRIVCTNAGCDVDQALRRSPAEPDSAVEAKEGDHWGAGAQIGSSAMESGQNSRRPLSQIRCAVKSSSGGKCPTRVISVVYCPNIFNNHNWSDHWTTGQF